MLFILTGGVQTGKTRWLQRLVHDAAGAGVPAFGVLAPGRWIPKTRPTPDGDLFDKVGIDNVLLPEGTTVPFATRSDLAREGGAFDEESQSAQAELGWHISDAAIEQVNAHFNRMMKSGGGEEPRLEASVPPGLLIVDELGRLELMHDGGLTSAMALLDRGPTDRFPNALIVVRDYLLDQAKNRFEPAWGPAILLAPNDESRSIALDALRTEDAKQ